MPLPGEDGLVLIGSFYLAVMIYLFLVLLFLDALRLIRALLPPSLKERLQPSGIAPRTKFLTVIGTRTDSRYPWGTGMPSTLVFETWKLFSPNPPVPPNN